MKKALLFALLAVALACSDRTREQTGPSTISPPSPPPGPSSSRVVLSGTVSAAETGSPIRNVRIQVVEGVNAGRETLANDGHYALANLEPGTFTLLFTTEEYRDLRRTEMVRADATLDVQLERKGLTLSGRITTQWGEPIGDAGVEAVRDGRVAGGGTSYLGDGMYRIPTLPTADYIVRVIKWGYVTPNHPLTMTGDTTLDFALDRVRVSLFGTVNEALPCSGTIQNAEVEIVSGPDAGIGVATTANGYQTDRRINWGTFRLRATKIGYVPAEVSMDVLPPGAWCFSCPYRAPSEVQQDFVLQRIGGC